ncbi:unnamed protein product [Rangifer tarandus platyrhynchus]|uniref:Uncharacterized protein n=1 Tax=Rangifer tarandus platyrhynchus TaxID=3082113 RepID=A0AC60A1X3_RANTA
MLLLCILTYDFGKCESPSLILFFKFVFLFRGTKKNNMTVKISFCIFCQILILITSNLEVCLCIKVLITILIHFTTMGYIGIGILRPIEDLLHLFWSYMFNFLSYSLVHRSKLLNIENDI